MKIVIDIPNWLYHAMLEHKEPIYSQSLGEAVRDGTPLLKGHGDIVDIETLIDMFWNGNSMEITKYDLSVIEPIIKADKAESEEK